MRVVIYCLMLCLASAASGAASVVDAGRGVVMPAALADAGLQVRFHHVTVADGLSNSEVHTALQDRRGFMWFGTRDGLNRFDGYRFIVYKPDVKRPTA